MSVCYMTVRFINLFHPEEMAARYYYEKNLSEIFLFHSLDSNGGGFIFQ